MPDLVLDYHRYRTPIDHPDLSIPYSKISPSTGGLLGIWSTYYTGASPYEFVPCLSIVHPTIDFTDYNPSGFADYYSFLGIGWIIPRYSETYTFYLTSDDSVCCSINGVKIVADNTLHGATTYSGTISLTANKMYPVLIGHLEHAASERLLFEWSSTSQARETVPSSRMAYPILGAVLGSEAPAYGEHRVTERPKYDWLLHELKMKLIPHSVEALGVPEALKLVEKKYGWTDIVKQARNLKSYLESKGVALSVWSAWENDFEVKWLRLEVRENWKTHNTFIDIGVRKDCFELSGDIVASEVLPKRVGNAYVELQSSGDYGDEVNGFVRENHHLAKMYYRLDEKPTILDDAIELLKAVGKIR